MLAPTQLSIATDIWLKRNCLCNKCLCLRDAHLKVTGPSKVSVYETPAWMCFCHVLPLILILKCCCAFLAPPLVPLMWFTRVSLSSFWLLSAVCPSVRVVSLSDFGLRSWFCFMPVNFGFTSSPHLASCRLSFPSQSPTLQAVSEVCFGKWHHTRWWPESSACLLNHRYSFEKTSLPMQGTDQFIGCEEGNLTD